MAAFEGWFREYPCGKKVTSDWRFEYPPSPECGCSFVPTTRYRFIPMPDPERRQRHRERKFLTDYCSPCREWFIVLRHGEQERHRHGV